MSKAGHAPLLSSAFRIAASGLAVFIAIVLAIVFVVFRQTDGALTSEMLSSLSTDAALIAREDGVGGQDGVRRAIEMRTSVDPDRLYLLAAADGSKIAGNLDRMPPEIAGRKGGGVFSYSRPSQREGARNSRMADHQAVAVVTTLNDGALLLVGRDIEREKALIRRVRLLAFVVIGALAVAGLVGAYLVSRHVLARVEAVNQTARSIMAGDLGRRIPIEGSGDEIDALAGNLNSMLDRIEQLMSGLREVSDNIAHDLKTPLNRLRNRAEAALREQGSAEDCHVCLERTIEEADELIKTFNALLLIARLEAGALEGQTEEVDLRQVVGDVAELYEPVAEEAGLSLSFESPETMPHRVNRHLIGQSVANLIDNAIKYAVGHAGDRTGDHAARSATRLDVTVRQNGEMVEIAVSDDGPGISAADRARVLKRFVRLEQSRSRPGTGLGLSMVAAVARLHGGDVRLEDNNPGLSVVLRLPRTAGRLNG